VGRNSCGVVKGNIGGGKVPPLKQSRPGGVLLPLLKGPQGKETKKEPGSEKVLSINPWRNMVANAARVDALSKRKQERRQAEKREILSKEEEKRTNSDNNTTRG